MTTPTVQRAIEESIGLTVQTVDRELPGNIYLVSWLARAGYLISPWWSQTRDAQLRQFWKKSDHLAGALYTMISKMQAIPTKVEARNKSNREHIEEARETTDIVRAGFQFGRGWVSFYGKWVEDLLSQDNGSFAEVIGYGQKNGVLIGQPVSAAHLDSYRCQRTGNATWPVIYTDIDGARYKLHDSRVMYASQMESPIADMFGVGFCGVSRCVNIAQNLIDIITYKMEKLGSRPHRQIIITQGGLDPEDIRSAFQQAESGMDAAGLSRYSKVVVGGSQTLPEADVKIVELSSMPDGFDEQTSITLGMAAIALALGTDARELFPALTAGATRADALLQHLKQRGKGPGQILQTTEDLMNFKFLPRHLMYVSDFQDDAQDRQAAEIRMVRANRRVQDFSTGAEDERTMREQMEVDGDIDHNQFEQMELRSGRLPDGTSVLALFFKNNPRYQRYLRIPGVQNPLDVENNDHERVTKSIYDNRAKVYETLANSGSTQDRLVATQCDAALTELELLYTPPMPERDAQSGEVQKPGGNGTVARKPGDNRPSQNNGPKSQYVDPRIRRTEGTVPSPGGAMENSFGDSGQL